MDRVDDLVWRVQGHRLCRHAGQVAFGSRDIGGHAGTRAGGAVLLRSLSDDERAGIGCLDGIADSGVHGLDVGRPALPPVDVASGGRLVVEIIADDG